MELMSHLYVKAAAFSASESGWFLGGGTNGAATSCCERLEKLVWEREGHIERLREGAGGTCLDFVLVVQLGSGASQRSGLDAS